jgi:hypothetical protein
VPHLHPDRRAPSAIASRVAGPLAVAIVAAGMLNRTWQTWPDPLVDYGREIYLAWQLSEGKMLYDDIVHFNGPLSAYFNALAFRVAHCGILGVAMANGLVAVACVAMLYALLHRLSDHVAATMAALTFVTVFACSRYYVSGNYTWLCSYSHELPHGVALGVATLWCLAGYQRSRRLAWLVAMGTALGLVALTKPETFSAGVLAATAGLTATLARERPSRRRLCGQALAVVAGAAGPLLVTFLWFVRRMPASEVLRGRSAIGIRHSGRSSWSCHSTSGCSVSTTCRGTSDWLLRARPATSPSSSRCCWPPSRPAAHGTSCSSASSSRPPPPRPRAQRCRTTTGSSPLAAYRSPCW